MVLEHNVHGQHSNSEIPILYFWLQGQLSRLIGKAGDAMLIHIIIYLLSVKSVLRNLKGPYCFYTASGILQPRRKFHSIAEGSPLLGRVIFSMQTRTGQGAIALRGKELVKDASFY